MPAAPKISADGVCVTSGAVIAAAWAGNTGTASQPNRAGGAVRPEDRERQGAAVGGHDAVAHAVEHDEQAGRERRSQDRATPDQDDDPDRTKIPTAVPLIGLHRAPADHGPGQH